MMERNEEWSTTHLDAFVPVRRAVPFCFGLYADRVAGGDRDPRHPGRNAVARAG
jgi:hypothetical protein